MLLVTFENGEKKIFDVKPYLTHKAFEQLNNKALFNTVKGNAKLLVVWQATHNVVSNFGM